MKVTTYELELMDSSMAALGLKSAAWQDLKALWKGAWNSPEVERARNSLGAAGRDVRLYGDFLEQLQDKDFNPSDHGAVSAMLLPYADLLGDKLMRSILNNEDPHAEALKKFTELKAQREKDFFDANIRYAEAWESTTVPEVRTDDPVWDAIRGFGIREAPRVAAKAMFIHALAVCGVPGVLLTAADVTERVHNFLTDYDELSKNSKLTPTEVLKTAFVRSGLSAAASALIGVSGDQYGMGDTFKGSVSKAIFDEAADKAIKQNQHH